MITERRGESGGGGVRNDLSVRDFFFITNSVFLRYACTCIRRYSNCINIIYVCISAAACKATVLLAREVSDKQRQYVSLLATTANSRNTAICYLRTRNQGGFVI